MMSAQPTQHPFIGVDCCKGIFPGREEDLAGLERPRRTMRIRPVPTRMVEAHSPYAKRPVYPNTSKVQGIAGAVLQWRDGTSDACRNGCLHE
jgi:hypothetical protein